MVQRYGGRHGVWTVSYLGWVPALGLLTPAGRHPSRRNARMIAAHLVWGTVITAATEYTRKRPNRIGNESKHVSDTDLTVSCLRTLYSSSHIAGRNANSRAAEDVSSRAPPVTILTRHALYRQQWTVVQSGGHLFSFFPSCGPL